jgi:hypothetical protein
MITSLRCRWVGGNVTPDVQEALEAEAGKLRRSRSATLYLLLRDALKQRGHDVSYEYRLDESEGRWSPR